MAAKPNIGVIPPLAEVIVREAIVDLPESLYLRASYAADNAYAAHLLTTFPLPPLGKDQVYIMTNAGVYPRDAEKVESVYAILDETGSNGDATGYSITHVPSGLRLAGHITSFKLATKIFNALVSNFPNFGKNIKLGDSASLIDMADTHDVRNLINRIQWKIK